MIGVKARRVGLSQPQRATGRFAEIDLLRGLSVLAMVAYHATWNLWYFRFIEADITGELYQSIARSIGTSFLGIMGLCLYISYTRAGATLSGWPLARKFLLRGAKILGYGALVSLVTHFSVDGTVLFGILHVIGVSIIVAPLFLSRPHLAGLAGLVIVFLGSWAIDLPVQSGWLVPLGIGEPAYYMVDYYPIIPWFGVVLVGIWLGSLLYPNGKRRLAGIDFSFIDSLPGIRGIRFLSRNALIVYLIHQPLLFGITLLAAILLGRA